MLIVALIGCDERIRRNGAGRQVGVQAARTLKTHDI